jgi:transketolase
VLADAPGGQPEVILIGTGRRCHCAWPRIRLSPGRGSPPGSVSLPCWELFEQRDQPYRDQALPPQVRARVTVEESSTYGWHRYAGTGGAILGMETFGASVPIQQVQAKFGFEPAHVIEAARDQLARWRRE